MINFSHAMLQKKKFEAHVELKFQGNFGLTNSGPSCHICDKPNFQWVPHCQFFLIFVLRPVCYVEHCFDLG